MSHLRLFALLLCTLIAAAETKLSVEQLQTDFRLFRKGLEEAHSGVYRYTAKRDMDAQFLKAERQLTAPLSVIQFNKVLLPVIAAIRCGHTNIRPHPEIRQQAAEAKMLPLRVFLEQRRVFVLLNQSNNEQIRPGMELLALNGLPIDKIIERILPNFSADGDIETGKLRSLGRRFPLAYWSFIGPAESYRLRLRDADGKRFEVTLQGLTEKEAEAAGKQNPVNTAALAALNKLEPLQAKQQLRYPDAPSTALIRIPGFGGRQYPDFLKTSFAEVKEKGIRNLIIDLRGNGGGADLYGALLVSYLGDKPFRYFDHIHWNTFEPSFRQHTDLGDRKPNPDQVKPDPAGGWLVTAAMHKGVDEQAPAPEHFTGRTFVLTDGGSFSTTADFCAITRHLNRAIFVGEETGGGYAGNNSGASLGLTLPESKLQVGIPMWEYFNAVKPGSRRGTRPDHTVVTRTSDLIRGVDTVLEATLQLIRK